LPYERYWKMSMLICPGWGKLTPVSRYDPRDYEPDMLVCELRGLGRARGFEVASVRSAFELMGRSSVRVAVERLCDRCLEILQMMLDNNVIGKQDIVKRLGNTDSERSDLPELVVRFLHRIDEFLYDADEETQKLAEELMRKARAGVE
jgi:hypothetical protein